MDAQSFLLFVTFMLSFFVKMTVEEDGPLTERQEDFGMFALCLVALYIFGETMEKGYDFLSFVSGQHWTIRSFVTLVLAYSPRKSNSRHLIVELFASNRRLECFRQLFERCIDVVRNRFFSIFPYMLFGILIWGVRRHPDESQVREFFSFSQKRA